MEFNEYQSLTEETAVYPESVGILYCSLGLSGETGEFNERIKKVLRDDLDLDEEAAMVDAGGLELNQAIRNELRSEKTKKELGDILWYWARLVEVLGYDANEIAEKNLDKLLDRKERDALHGSGDDR